MHGSGVKPGNTVVLGIGNLLLSDEGVGVHLAHHLMQHPIPQVEVVEGGVDGLGLMSVILDAERLIVVDAVRGGEAPGTLYRFTPETLYRHHAAYQLSLHEMGILEALHLAGLVGEVPPTVIIGVEPRSTAPGMTLSAEIRDRFPGIIAVIMEELSAQKEKAR